MKWSIALLLITLTATASAQGSVAPCQSYWDAAAVFLARVEAVKRQGSARSMSLTVIESFRGAASNAIEAALVTSRREQCQAFVAGSEYLIYATRDADGRLAVDACGRTRRVEDAGADLEYARAVRQGAAPAGYVTGSVIVGQRTLGGKERGFVRSAPGQTVTLTRDGDVIASTKTNGGMGSYRLDIPAAGRYRLAFEVPDGFYSDVPTADVVLSDASACAAVSGVLFDDGHLNGRVVDAKGRPLAGLTIELLPSGGGAGRRTVTDRAGRFAWTKVPAGRFTLSVPDASRDARSHVYYSGADGAAAASHITLAEGERKDLPDFRLPAHRSYFALSGVVLDASGAPAEGARVFLKSAGGDERIVSEAVIADFMGKFVMTARAGLEYGVFAERARAGARAGSVDVTDTHRVTVTEGLTPLRLVLVRR